MRAGDRFSRMGVPSTRGCRTACQLVGVPALAVSGLRKSRSWSGASASCEELPQGSHAGHVVRPATPRQRLQRFDDRRFHPCRTQLVTCAYDRGVHIQRVSCSSQTQPQATGPSRACHPAAYTQLAPPSHLAAPSPDMHLPTNLHRHLHALTPPFQFRLTSSEGTSKTPSPLPAAAQSPGPPCSLPLAPELAARAAPPRIATRPGPTAHSACGGARRTVPDLPTGTAGEGLFPDFGYPTFLARRGAGGG